MFRAVRAHYIAFFLFFGILAALSLAYDIGALCLASFAVVKREDNASRRIVREYIKAYGSWLWQDLLYVTATWSLFGLTLHHYSSWPTLFSSIFFSISLIGIVLDVIVLQPALYRKI
jgi:hypothetical protein